MVKHSARGTNKDVDTSLELAGLIFNRYTTVNGQGLEFVISVLQSLNHILNLEERIKIV